MAVRPGSKCDELHSSCMHAWYCCLLYWWCLCLHSLICQCAAFPWHHRELPSAEAVHNHELDSKTERILNLYESLYVKTWQLSFPNTPLLLSMYRSVVWSGLFSHQLLEALAMGVARTLALSSSHQRSAVTAARLWPAVPFVLCPCTVHAGVCVPWPSYWMERLVWS